MVAVVVGAGEPREQGWGGFVGFAHKAGVAAVFALRLDKLLDNGWEYEFDIDAVTGAIVKWKVDRD